jgi:CRP-like cAMP-binding protein
LPNNQRHCRGASRFAAGSSRVASSRSSMRSTSGRRPSRAGGRRQGVEAVFRSEIWSLILEQPTTLEKVRSFLVQVQQHMLDCGGNALVPLLSQHDIADCLGLSVAEVSRALNDLKGDNEMRIASMCHVTIVHRDACDEENG